jgi:hypothetical protein
MPDFTSTQHSTNATCLASEVMSLTTSLYPGAARPAPFAHQQISAARLIEILEAALDVVSSVDEDDFFMVADEKSSSKKKKNDD